MFLFKNMDYIVIGWLEKKNKMIYEEKNANIRGKRWKNGEKRKFIVLEGEKYHSGKMGEGGKNINYFENIHPWNKVL